MHNKSVRASMVTALAVSTLTSVLAGVAGAAPTAQKRPGWVTGTAVTECGQPVKTFKVEAYGFDGQPNEYPYGLPPLGWATGHNGVYAFRTVDSIRHVRPVNALVRSVEGTAMVTYRGLDYQLPMWPTDGKPNGLSAGDFSARSGNGIVRNFVLRTSGVKPGMGKYAGDAVDVSGAAVGAFYGGNITLDLSFGNASLTLQVTLRPTGPLVDGCASHAVTHTIKLTGWQANGTVGIHDIPLAPYTMSVMLSGAVNRPAQLQLYGSSTTGTSIPLSFQSSSMFEDASGPNLVSVN